MTKSVTKKSRKIVFLSGTRADYGKLSLLIKTFDAMDNYWVEVVATGMHLLSRYGYTVNEIHKAGIRNVFPIFNQDSSTSEKMDVVLANTLIQLSHYLNERRPDLLVVHGDRVEALAGAIAGSLNGIRVAHFEGGEVSGTIDESIRHAISKMAHVHFVANHESEKRLLQMGETEESVFVVGSAEIDVMLSNTLPSIDDAKAYYDVVFSNYAILIYHPVTTELDELDEKTTQLLAALKETDDNFIIIRPNNDIGTTIVDSRIQEFALAHSDRVRLFRSIQFEKYLSLLKHARYIIGNSSSGIREAQVFGVPCINVGSRQNNRATAEGIFNVNEDKMDILSILSALPSRVEVSTAFGYGNTIENVKDIFDGKEMWNIPIQKVFRDR